MHKHICIRRRPHTRYYANIQGDGYVAVGSNDNLHEEVVWLLPGVSLHTRIHFVCVVLVIEDSR